MNACGEEENSLTLALFKSSEDFVKCFIWEVRLATNIEKNQKDFFFPKSICRYENQREGSMHNTSSLNAWKKVPRDRCPYEKGCPL